jgi:hypothetical protein
MAHCPNIRSEEWQKLVAAVDGGELEAHAAYIKNGYDIPEVDEDGNFTIDSKPKEDVPLTDIDQEARYLQGLTKARNKILNSLKVKRDIYEGNKEFIEKLEKLIKDFENADIARSMVIYMKNVESTIASLNKKMDKDGNSLEFVKLLHDYAGTFHMIEDVSKMIEDRKDVSQAVKNRVSKLVGEVRGFNNKYLSVSKRIMADKLAQQSTIARSKAKIQYGREYEENHPRKSSTMSKKDYNAAKKEYVEDMLNKNRDAILRAEKNHVRNLMETAPNDISNLTYHIIDGRGVNDHLIQLAVQQLDKADFAAKEQFIKDRNDAISVFEEFTKSRKGIIHTDQKKLYDGIIEKIDGKETSFYVREYYSTYYKALNDSRQEQKIAKSEEERSKISSEFRKKYQVYDKSIKRWVPKKEFVNPQYQALQKDSPAKKMYDYLVDFNKRSDSMINSRMKLGYRLPSVTKATMATANDNGLKSAGARIVKDTFKIQKDDYQYGEHKDEDGVMSVIADEKGDPLRRVAMPYRNNIDIKDQSFDLMGMALSNRFASLNFQEKNEIRAELEVLENIMKEREIVNTKDGKRMVRKMLGVTEGEHEELTKKGINSNSYKLLHSLMEDRLYGRRNVKGPEVMGISVDKVSEKLIQLSSHNLLIANYMGGGANVLAGKVMNFFEGTRKIHYSRKDLRAAEKKYFGDFVGWSKDVGRIGRPTSKTNMLIEKFLDTSMDFSGMSNKLANDTRFKELFQMKTLHGINNAAEHYIQSTLVYALLNNTKVTNKNGEFIDNDGNVTTDRDKAMTMDKAYEAKDGKLTWKNEDWTIEGFDEFNGDVEFAMSRKAKDITADLQGNYDDNNRAQIQRYWYGKLGFFLRKWMVRGVQRRWRGIDKVGKGNIEDVAFYSEGQEQFKEGTYTSAARYLRNVWLECKMLQTEVYSKEWNKLSDVEKANIKSAAFEIGMMVASFASATLLAGLAKGADSEEEEEFLYTLAYWSRRQYGELLFYVPPFNIKEVGRLARTPSAVQSSIELTTKLTEQLLEDAGNMQAEVYQSGRHKGEYKSDVLMNKLFNPFYKNFSDRDAKESLGYLTNIRQ